MRLCTKIPTRSEVIGPYNRLVAALSRRDIPLGCGSLLMRRGGVREHSLTPPPLYFGRTPLRGELLCLGPAAIGQKRPSVTLGLEIAQAPIRQANGLAVPPDVKFPVGRTTDLEVSELSLLI